MTAALDMFFARARRSPFERDLEAISAAVSTAMSPGVGANLVALLLVGECARADAASPRTSARPAEIALVAVVSDANSASIAAGWDAAATASRVAGAPVTVSVVGRAAMLAPTASLTWLDVALGNVRVLFGDGAVLDAVKRIRARDVSLDEAARSLSKRAAGLALARLDGDVAAFPRRAMRRVYEAVLACGDARLLAANQYGATRAERALAIEHLAERRRVPAELAGAYRAATLFFARPDAVAVPSDLARWFDDHVRKLGVWHMGFESFRLAAPITALAFAWRSAPLFPRPRQTSSGGSSSTVRAFLRGEAALFAYDGLPRERFARASVALAYLDDQRGHALAARWLGLPGDSPRSAIRDALRDLSALS